MKVKFTDLGLTHFKDAWDIQKDLFKLKQNDKSAPDFLLLTQHYPVYTLGKTGDRNHLLTNEKQLKENGIEYYEIDRGGDITYHGPGQLVVYPIFDLNNYYRDTHKFLRDLEETVILTLANYNIEAYREEEFTGVWVGGEKICAIGIKVSRWITMHGLAFNVNNDITFFDKIIPCGIFHKGVTNMEQILNGKINIDETKKNLMENFSKVFNIDIENHNVDQLKKELSENRVRNLFKIPSK